MGVNYRTAPLQDLRMLKQAEVSAVVGLSESQLRKLEREGKFPKRVAVGGGSVRWPESAIREWLAERAAHGKLTLKGTFPR